MYNCTTSQQCGGLITTVVNGQFFKNIYFLENNSFCHDDAFNTIDYCGLHRRSQQLTCTVLYVHHNTYRYHRSDYLECDDETSVATYTCYSYSY